MKRYIKADNSVHAGVFYLKGNCVATNAIAERFKELNMSTRNVLWLRAEYIAESDETKVVYKYASVGQENDVDITSKSYYALTGYEEYDEGNIDYIDGSGDGYSIADVVLTDSELTAKEYFERQYHMRLPNDTYSIAEIDDKTYQEWREYGSDATII